MNNDKFYSHLIEVDTLEYEIDNMDLEDKQKSEIKSLIEASLHHTILDAVLSELSEDDKKKFLSHLVEDNHDKIWNLLNDKVENIEDKIKKAAEDIKKELHKDLK